MTIKELTDKFTQPREELIYKHIGDKELLWKQIMSYLHDHDDITETWRYYKDGKSWLLRIMKKKKTICWIRILEDTFRVAFYFAVRLEPDIMKSDLSYKLKSDFENGKTFNKTREIYIDLQHADEVEEVKKLIDLKIKF